MKYELGNGASFSKTVTESDVYLFAGITGDMNDLHINQEYAGQTVFKGRIAHGLLVGGLISTVLGMKFPGPGTIYLEQNLVFKAPVKIGDTVTAKVETEEIINAEKGIIRLNTVVTNQNKDCVITGYAVVRVPEEKIVFEQIAERVWT